MLEICVQHMTKIFSLLTDTEVPTLYINGYIGSDETVNCDVVKQILSQVKGNRLNMEVNSGGGSMIEGFTIYDMLVNSGFEINVTVTGIAGSMAGVVILAGNTIAMYKHARIMTHKPKLFGMGEAEQIEAQVKLANDMEKQVKELFKKRTGKSAKVIDSWFTPGVDKWFNSSEALEANIVDTVIEGAVHIPDDQMPKASSESELVTIYNSLNFNNMSKTPLVLNKATADKLGLPVNTDLEQVVEKSEALASENATLKADNDKLKSDLAAKEAAEVAAKETAASELVENAIKAGKIGVNAKESFIKNAVSNYADVKAMLDAIPSRTPLHQRVKEGSPANAAEDRSSWTYIDYAKKDPKALAEMRASNPEAFEALKK